MGIQLFIIIYNMFVKACLIATNLLAFTASASMDLQPRFYDQKRKYGPASRRRFDETDFDTDRLAETSHHHIWDHVKVHHHSKSTKSSKKVSHGHSSHGSSSVTVHHEK